MARAVREADARQASTSPRRDGRRPIADEPAADARAAFLEGWAAEAGTPAPAVLAAFEADKAVYEALYESHQRPDWLPIPLGALERISARGAGAGSAG